MYRFIPERSATSYSLCHQTMQLYRVHARMQTMMQLRSPDFFINLLNHPNGSYRSGLGPLF